MKDSSFTKKQLEAIEKEIRILEEKCRNQVMALNEKKNAIKEINIYNREQTADVIAYLVGKIEGKKYIAYEHHISLDIKRENKKVDYTLTYLVEESKEKFAEREIQTIFDKTSEISAHSDEFIDSFYVGSSKKYDFRYEKFLDYPGKNYIQLSYYKTPDDYISNHEYYRITEHIVYLKEHGLNRFWGMENELRVGISNICDERYHYIVDFIDTITEYKLREFDFKPSKEVMYKLADEFISSYKPKKPYTYKI